MVRKARGTRLLEETVVINGKRRRLYRSETGHTCGACKSAIEPGELYTHAAVGNAPVCRKCGPFEIENRQVEVTTHNPIEVEAAYRHGWTQAADEMSRLVLQLVELGYKPTEIRQLFAVYDDHFLALWRQADDLSERSAPPPFDIIRCQEILQQTSGYDWIR